MRLFVTVFILFLLLPLPAFAEEAKRPEWWQIITGVIGIPAALIGLVLTYATLKKTKLESRKIELEIREKQGIIANTTAAASPEAQEVAQQLINPLIDNNRVNYLILRFVIFYLILQFWTVVSDVFNYAAGGTFFALQNLFGLSVRGVPELIFVAASMAVKFGWVAVVLLFGVPLYRDIAKHIGFSFTLHR